MLLEQGKCVVDFVYIILWRWPVPDADVIDAIGQENDRRIQRDKLLQVVNDLFDGRAGVGEHALRGQIAIIGEA